MIQLLRRLFGGRFTKDQVVAVSLHVVTAVASGMPVAVALGLMGQDDADRAVEMVRQIGEGVAVIVGALGVLLPIISALFAGKSASPTAQIRKVESIPDVTVVAVIPKATCSSRSRRNRRERPRSLRGANDTGPNRRSRRERRG